MSLFNIGAPTGLSGVSAQAYVDPAAGSDTKLAANVLETVGTVGKQVYGGYVLAEMSTLPEAPTDQTTDKLTSAVQQGEISESQAKALFMSRYNNKNAQLAALGANRETALKKAPWLTSEIDRLYKNQAEVIGGSDMFTELLDSQALQLVKDGHVLLEPTDTDADIRYKVFQYSVSKQQQMQAEGLAKNNVQQALQAFTGQVSNYQQELFTKIAQTIKDPNLSPTDKQTVVNQVRSQALLQLKSKYQYSKMSSEQKSNFDNTLKQMNDSFDLYMKDDYLTGKTDLNAIVNANQKVLEKARELGYKDATLAQVMVYREMFGDSALVELMLSGQLSPSKVYTALEKTTMEAFNLKPVADDAKVKVHSTNPKEQAIGLALYGGLGENFKEIVGAYDEQDMKTLARDATNFLTDGLTPTFEAALKANRITQDQLEGIKFVKEGDKYLFRYEGEGEKPSALLLKLNKEIVPSLHGVVNILSTGSDTPESVVALINGYIPAQRPKTTGDLVVETAYKVGSSIAERTMDTKELVGETAAKVGSLSPKEEAIAASKFLQDLFSVNKIGDRISPLGKKLDEKEAEAFETLKGFFNNFSKEVGGDE